MTRTPYASSTDVCAAVPLLELAAYAGYAFVPACASLLVQLLPLPGEVACWRDLLQAQVHCLSHSPQEDSQPVLGCKCALLLRLAALQAVAARHTTLCGPTARCASPFSWSVRAGLCHPVQHTRGGGSLCVDWGAALVTPGLETCIPSCRGTDATHGCLPAAGPHPEACHPGRISGRQ